MTVIKSDKNSKGKEWRTNIRNFRPKIRRFDMILIKRFQGHKTIIKI